MTTYGLYLESGPKRKTTMVHVLDLLGCHVRRRTTEEAVEAAPGAIRRWLRFLEAHGEDADPEAEFETDVVVHVMGGTWLGNGDPVPGFEPDFRPIDGEELRYHLRHLDWIQSALLRFATAMPELPGDGRELDAILRHVGVAGTEHLRCSLEKPEALRAPVRSLQKEEGPLPELLEAVWDVSQERLEASTDEERAARIQRGEKTWTVRRTLRRLLEHGWEHLCEIEDRLETQRRGRG